MSKKFAIYDPDVEKFVSNVDGGTRSLCMTWSDKITSAQLYSTMEAAVSLLDGAKHGNHSIPARPNVMIVEVSLSWSPTGDETYREQKAIYERHLPTYRADIDSLSEKDWRLFKAARSFLRIVGETVE